MLIAHSGQQVQAAALIREAGGAVCGAGAAATWNRREQLLHPLPKGVHVWEWGAKVGRVVVGCLSIGQILSTQQSMPELCKHKQTQAVCPGYRPLNRSIVVKPAQTRAIHSSPPAAACPAAPRPTAPGSCAPRCTAPCTRAAVKVMQLDEHAKSRQLYPQRMSPI